MRRRYTKVAALVHDNSLHRRFQSFNAELAFSIGKVILGNTELPGLLINLTLSLNADVQVDALLL